MTDRYYPISEEFFEREILPQIEGDYIWQGRPPKISHYQAFCAILYVLRTGIPWRDLPKCYGNWHSIYMRFARGNERGLWWKILCNLQQRKKLKLNIVICDTSSFKVHRHGGGQKKGIQSKGKSRAGLTTKLHMAITGDGHVVEGFLTGGNKADVSFAEELTEKVIGYHVVEDKGYDSDSHRRNLEANNNIPVIPGRRNRKQPISYDKEKYKLRKRIENFFAKLKENRRLALRFEKDDSSFLGFVALACIKTYLC